MSEKSPVPIPKRAQGLLGEIHQIYEQYKKEVPKQRTLGAGTYFYRRSANQDRRPVFELLLSVNQSALKTRSSPGALIQICPLFGHLSGWVLDLISRDERFSSRFLVILRKD
jgi:hypothetical protein